MNYATSNTAFTQNNGDRYYELTNHLGNVLAVVTDRKFAQPDGGGGISHYLPDMVSATDYYPFVQQNNELCISTSEVDFANPAISGRMQMSERSFSSGSYRYGFNGKEKDSEGMGGGGSTYDYGFRIYNPQIAKFLSVDPLFQSFPWYTTYQFAGNKPIIAIDLDGLEELFVTQIYAGGEIIDESMSFVDGRKSYLKIITTKITYHGAQVYYDKPEHPIHTSVQNEIQLNWGVGLQTFSAKKVNEIPIVLDNSLPEMVPIPIYGANSPSGSGKLDISPAGSTKKPSSPKPSTPTPPSTPAARSVTKNLTLNVDFEPDRISFSNENQAAEILTPYLNILLNDPSATISLCPNTQYSRGQDIMDLWGLTADGDTSDELVKGRGETIEQWFLDRGVNKNQLSVNITNANFNNAINVTATLTQTVQEENE